MKKIAVLSGSPGMKLSWLESSCTIGDFQITYMNCDNGLDADCLLSYDAVINTLGRYFEETSAPAIQKYYDQHGLVIHLGPNAMTVPYIVRDGKVIEYPEQVDMIRTTGCVDLYVPLDVKPAAMTANAPHFEKLAAILSACTDVSGFCSANYNLLRGKVINENGVEPAPNLQICERIVPLLSMKNGQGSVLALPVVKTVSLEKGTMLYFNFTSEEFWNGAETQAAFWNCVAEEIDNSFAVYAEASFACYRPEESGAVYLNLFRTSKPEKTEKVSVHMTLLGTEELSFGSSDWKVLEERELEAVCGTEQTIALPTLPEGCYRVVFHVNGANETTASFYVLTRETMEKKAADFERLVLDSAVSPEFHTQGGVPAPVHGTTYFVSDVFRSCFLHMNPWLCDVDMREIAEKGFNLLRAGMWKETLVFYGKNGEIAERAIRAMEATFYTALCHGLTMQFVLGNVEMNNWDNSRSALHNPETQEKCYRVLGRFFREFRAFTNVQMDIINEPSYTSRAPWSTGRPSHDPDELKHWREWLREQYHGDISELRTRWGRAAVRYASFDEIPLPADDAFSRFYNRTTEYEFHVVAADFFRFARESYSKWCAGIMELRNRYAPEMVLLMGRDESIRIPCEQDEYFAGNIDTINWHQWQRNGIVFTEYMLNKVPDSICCGQELGMYQMENHRGQKRLNPEEIGKVLERKLLYSFGNWVQWQWMNDPYMPQVSENTLGIYRADRTETPGLDCCFGLAAAEQRTAPLMAGPDRAESNIIVVHPTSMHFSCDQRIAEESIRTAVRLLGYDLKEHFFVALEHTLSHYAAEGGKLYIVPSAGMLRRDTWELLLSLLKKGNHVLVTGSIEQDDYALGQNRIRALDNGFRVEPLCNCEMTEQGSVNFGRATDYCDTMHALDKCVKADRENRLYEFKIGEGTLYYYPLPAELADDKSLAAGLYREVLARTGLAAGTFTMTEGGENSAVLVRVQKFERSIVYTFVNEGEKATLRLTDHQTGAKLSCTIDAGRGVKVWLGLNGELLDSYQGGESCCTVEA